MKNVKYTDSVSFRCLEYLRETSLDINLIHAGKECCAPSHICSRKRDEFIIHFVVSGKGFYTTKSGKMFQLSKGQMFLIQPGDDNTYGSDTTEPWEYAWIGFNGIRADSIIKQCGFSTSKLILPYPDDLDVITDYINRILDSKTLTFGNDLRREAWMLLLFSRLIDYHASLSHKRPENNNYGSRAYVELAIEYIKCNYQDGINVSDISAQLGISRAYLNYTFQKELSMSIQKFLIDFRMHKAASLLVSTADTVKEISQAVGYEDQLTFSKAFKKKFGNSPKNYRTQKLVTVNYNEKQIVDHPEDFT